MAHGRGMGRAGLTATRCNAQLSRDRKCAREQGGDRKVVWGASSMDRPKTRRRAQEREAAADDLEREFGLQDSPDGPGLGADAEEDIEDEIERALGIRPRQLSQLS